MQQSGTNSWGGAPRRPTFFSVALRYWAPCLCGIALTALILCWAEIDGKASRLNAFNEMARSAETLSQALKGGLQTEIRRGFGRRAKLQEIMDSVVSKGDVLFVRIYSGSWRLTSTRPDMKGRLHPPDFLPTHCGSVSGVDVFYFWRSLSDVACRTEMEVAPPCQTDDSQAEILKFNVDSPSLLVGVSTRGMDAAVSEAGRRRCMTAAAAFLAAVVLSAAWAISIKSRLLQEDLALSKAKADRLEELSLAAAGIAHETKNPLGLIRGLAQRIHDDASTPDVSRDAAGQILDEVDTTSERVADFLSYAKPRRLTPTPIPAKAFAYRMAGLLSPDAEAKKIVLTADADDIQIEADHDAITQITVNLLLNSLAASTAAGQVNLAINATPGRTAQLVVSDHGTGIPDAILPDIFKPYVSGRAGGFGLGLAITKRLADEAGWRVGVRTTLGGGTTMTISGIRQTTSKNGHS